MVRATSSLFVLLLIALQVVAVVRGNSGNNLIRKRREWILPPKPLLENVDYTKEESIARIRSDYEGDRRIEYSLKGKGASEFPFHVFTVDRFSGNVQVTRVLDREDIDTYNLSGVASFTDGTPVEQNIDLRIKVIDENDNNPVFGKIATVEVDELSPEGTSVMTVKATDADEPGNKNSEIAYTLVNQKPPDDMFKIHKNGTIYMKKSTLDREKCDEYVLTVMGQDLGGQPEGKTGTGTVTIKIRDVNDNPPTLEKDMYEGSVEENKFGVEVMRLKTEDLDMEGTDNWEAVFEIVKGNEAGYFSIRTDPDTNEGILMLEKPLDYEDIQSLDLGLALKNKAPLVGDGGNGGATINIGGGGSPGGGGGGGSPGGGGGSPGGGGGSPGGGGGSPGGGGGSPGGGGGSPGGGGGGGSPSGGGSSGGGGSSSGGGGNTGGGTPGATGAGIDGSSSGQGGGFKTYPIKINVKNQPEGAKFDPKVKAIPISEGGNSINIKEVIASYPATDADTGKPAENVRYAKGFDPDNWLTIDPNTAEISLNKMPDRESPLLVNGTYFAKILCISEDVPAKTATGTIAIQVEDYNDHCPELTSKFQSMCTIKDSVIVNAIDEDAFPNGAPFEFTIVPEGTEGKWQVEHLNETAAIVRAQNSMWPGLYTVELAVKDQQGQACSEPQKVTVNVCTCEDGVVCGKPGAKGQPEKGSQLGPAGIGLLLLGLLLLLLIPLLLLFCQCGGASSFPDLFTEMPFDTKSHLINYHTERQGDNAEVPLLNMPLQVGTAGTNILNMAPMAKFEMQQSLASMNGMNGMSGMSGMNGVSFQDGYGSGHREGMLGMSQWEGSGLYTQSDGQESGGDGGLFNGIALSDHFLRDYYSQVTSGNEGLGVRDSLLVYDYEGQGSLAGSVGCCSLLESDNDLQFLNDLGLKFKTLAEICGGKKVENDEPTPLPSAPASSSQIIESSLVTGHQLSNPPMRQPTIAKAEQTMVNEVVDHSQVVRESIGTLREGMTSTRAEMGNQSQMLLLQQQQPVYYTTTPVLQPMHYVVQPQLQNAMILAEAPATNLQDMVLVSSTETGPSQRVIVQGQTLMPSGQAQGSGTMLLDNRGIQGSYTNLIHAGNFSGSQPMMVVEGRVPAGSVKLVKGIQTGSVHEGTLQLGELSGSQRVLMVGESASNGGLQVQEARGALQKSEASGLQGILYSNSGLSTGSQSITSSTKMSKTPTIRKVVVQETREVR